MNASPMALYDVPIHSGYKILTHTSSRRFAKNGFGQVGNTTLPTNPINPSAVIKSSIYNKNLSLRGISEAGYGRRYPNYHLSGNRLSYSGAGSPRSSLSYPGAGSPRTSLRYSGAGSPKSSLRYSGAGSPRTSVLRDAYINDNLPPGSLGKIGIPGRRNSIRGLADEAALVDTGETYGPSLPPAEESAGFLDTIQGAFSKVFGTAVTTAAQAGQSAASNAVANAINPPPKPNPVQQAISVVKSTLPKTVLGMTAETAMIVAAGLGAYYFFKKN